MIFRSSLSPFPHVLTPNSVCLYPGRDRDSLSTLVGYPDSSGWTQIEGHVETQIRLW